MSDIALKITSDSSQAQQDLSKLTKAVDKIESTATTATRSLAALASSVTAAFAAFSAFNAINRASDSFTNLENKIALVVGRTKDLIIVQEQLTAASIRTRGTLEGTAEIFNKFGMALKGTGASTKQLITATENVQKAIAISGAEAESARGAIIQLGQGLSSGVLRGEELNSVLEQTPRIAQAIADGMGVTVGQLKNVAAEGRLTSDVVFNSLISQTGKLNEEFGKLNPTFQQSTTRLKEAFKGLLNEFSKATGFTNILSNAMNRVASEIEGMTQVADVYLLVFGSRFKEIIGDVKLVSVAIYNLFKVVGEQIVRTVPVIRTFAAPLTAIANSFLFDSIRNSFDKFYDSMFKARQEVRGVVEALGFFVFFGDTRVSRTLGDIFRSDSIVELTSNINKLTAGLDPKRLFNFLDIRISLRDKFIRPFYEAQATLKSFGSALGLINNPIIEFSNIRFDRFVEAGTKSLEVFQYTLEAIVYPAVVKLSTYIAEFALNSIEYIRSILGIGPSFLTVIERSTKRIAVALGIYTTSALYIDRLAGALTGALTIFQSIPEGIMNAYRVTVKYFTLLIDTVAEKSKGFKKVETLIKDFLENVKKFFYDAWDAVVGHSYWPDLVDGVLAYANKLYSQGTATIGKFTSFVSDSFESLVKYVNKINFSKLTDGLKSVTDSFGKDALLSALSSFGNLARDTFSKGKEYIIEAKLKLQALSGSDIKELIPTDEIATTIKRIATAIVLATVLAIASPAKFAVIAGALVVSLEAAIAQKVAAGLYQAFNMDFFREVGDTVGTIVGMYFAKALESLPDIMRNIAAFADAFGHAFLEQFGIIGNGLSALINVFSVGETGLLGFLLFGGGMAILFSNIKSLKDTVEGVGSFLNGISGGTKDQGGVLGQALIGSNFKYLLTATAVIIAGFSDQMSGVAAAFTAAPLLFTAIVGEDVTGKLIKDTIGKILGYFITQTMAAAATLSKSKLAISIFGDVKANEIGEKISKAKDVIKGAISNLNDQEARKAYTEGKMSFLDLLFGKQNDSDIRKQVDEKVAKAGDAIKGAAVKFGDKIKDLANNDSIIEKVVTGTKGVNPAAKVAEQVAEIKSRFETFSKETDVIAGAGGLLGKLVANKGAIMAAVVAALTLFSAQANAAETEVVSATSNIVNSIMSMLGEYGIYALLVPPAGWVFLYNTLGNAVTAVKMVGGAFATVTASTAAATTAMGSFASKVLPAMATVQGAISLLGVGLKALMAGFVTFMGVVGTAIGFAVTMMGRLLMATLAFLATPIGLIITGATAIVGILATYFFGDGDTFMKKLDSVIRKLGRIFSFKSNKQKELESILPTTSIGENSIDFKRQLANVNYDKLSERQFEGLKKAAERTAELVKRAKEEEEDFGRVTADTAAELDKFTKLLNTKLDKTSFGNSIQDVSDALKQAAKESDNMFIHFNKNLDRQVPFFSKFDFNNLMLPFEQLLSKYTVFNDSDAKRANSLIEDTSYAFKDMEKYLKPDELNAMMFAVNRVSSSMRELGGFSAILEKVFPSSFSRQREELDRASNALIKLREELVAVAETRQKVKKFNDDLTSLQARLKTLGEDVNFADLYSVSESDRQAMLDVLIPKAEELKKKLKDEVYDEIKALEIQQEINATVNYMKFTIDKSKLQANFTQELETLLKTSNINLDLNQYIKNVDKTKFIQMKSEIDGLKERIGQADLDIKKAKGLDELAEATNRLKEATKQLLNIYESTLGNKAALVSARLAEVGLTVGINTLDALGGATMDRIQKMADELKGQQLIAENAQDQTARTAAAKRSFFLKRQLDELAQYTARTFSEQFSFIMGKTNLSLDLMNAIKLSPAEAKEASALIVKAIDLKKQLEALPANAAGMAVDQTKAQDISAKILEAQKRLDELTKTFVQRLSDNLSKSGSKVDINDIIRLDATDIKAIDDINRQIILMEEKKDKIGKGKKSVFANDVADLQKLNIDIEKLKRERDAIASRDLVAKIESLAGKANVAFSQEILNGIDSTMLAKLSTYEDQMYGLLEARKKLSTTKEGSFLLINPEAFDKNQKDLEKLKFDIDKTLNGEIPAILKRANIDFDKYLVFNPNSETRDKIKTEVEGIITAQKELDKIMQQSTFGSITEAQAKRVEELNKQIRDSKGYLDTLKVPKTFGETVQLIESVGSGLSREGLLRLDPGMIKSIIDSSKNIKAINDEINRSSADGLEIDKSKLDNLKTELDRLKQIADIEGRRQQISSTFLNQSSTLISDVIKGVDKPFKKFADSVTGSIVDNFATQLSTYMFKGIADSLGSSLSDLFGMGKLGASPMNAMWVRSVDALTQGANAANSIMPGLGSIFTGIGNLGSSIFSGIGSLFSGTMFGAQAGVLQQAMGPMQWFADGGVVNGAGATPVMAHAGEVILNEAQQARVAAAMNQPAQQQISVNITGDISRQTKSEIYRMLPSIAEGVNAHNREKGYRG